MRRSNTSSSPPPLWPWRLALVLSLLPLIAALGFLIAPATTTAIAAFPNPTTPTTATYLTLLTARELYVSLTAIVLWWRREVRAVGCVVLLVAVLPAVDGWVAWQEGGAWWQVVQHWATVPVCVAVGSVLMNA